jgi:hypothetical protein
MRGRRPSIIVRTYSRPSLDRKLRSSYGDGFASGETLAKDAARKARLRYEELKAEAETCTLAEKAYVKLGEQVEAATPEAKSRIDLGMKTERARQAWKDADDRAKDVQDPYNYYRSR